MHLESFLILLGRGGELAFENLPTEEKPLTQGRS